MTVEEKVGQLGVFTRPSPGEDAWNTTLSQVRRGEVGGFFNGAGVATNRHLQRLAVEESRLGIPLLFAGDVWHGMWTIFPVPLAEASAWSPYLSEETARATAVEAGASGLSWTFAPMVDLARDQRWGRNVEGAGEDPFLASLLAEARVRGFQGPDLHLNTSLGACLKHFAGYSGVEAGLDYSETDISLQTFREMFLPPFQAGIDAGAVSVMSALNALNGVPCSGNRWLLSDLLRGELQFLGLVVSDYESDTEMVPFGFVQDDSDAARVALAAGVDMSMQSGAFRSHLPKLAAHGRLDMKRLDEAVRHVLQLKARLGLFQDPYRSLDPRGEWPQGGLAEKHDELARRAARESLVLLKNDGQLLPLTKCYARIALVGWWENDMDNAEGVGVNWGNKSHTVTLRQGLLDVVGAENLRALAGSRMDTRIPGGITAAVEAASWADVVVLALGEGVNYTGESRSRWDIGLPSAQQELAEAVALTGKPLVVLLKNGRALQLDGAVKDAASIMVTWFLGKMTGAAIADVLFGDYSPSGRLPVSFPISGGQAPYHYNHRSTGRPCAWPKHFTNCWVDGPSRALYPFGHGLTYSQVIYEDLWLSSDKLDWDGEIWIQCTVVNAGRRAVQEVVQLYVRDRVASRIRPIRELKGFRKLLLEPGKRETVSFSLARHQLSFFVEGAVPTAEPGAFDVFVAPSSAGGTGKRFELLPPLETHVT